MIEYEQLKFKLDNATTRAFFKDVLAYLLKEGGQLKLQEHSYFGGLYDGERAAKIELLRKLIRIILACGDSYSTPDTSKKTLTYEDGISDGKRIAQLHLLSIIHRYAER